jgi:hypothetical protein
VGDRGLDALEAFQQLLEVVVLLDGEGAVGLQHHHLDVLEVAATWRRIAAISSCLVIR